MLANNKDPQEVLEFLANTLTNKLTHAPSVRMREAAEAGDEVLLDAALGCLALTRINVNPSLQRKLETIVERVEEVSALLSDPDVIADSNRFRELSVEYSQLNPVVNCFADLATGTQRRTIRSRHAQGPRPRTARNGQRRTAVCRGKARTAGNSNCKPTCCPGTPMTHEMCTWKSAPVPVVMKPLYLPATCSACIRAMLNHSAGR